MEEIHYKLLVKRYFLYTITIYLFFVCYFVLLCFIVDPLQLFHSSWFLPRDMLSKNMREQAIGIINHYEFDSIILGTSMLQNTSSAEAGEKLGGTFFNISMSGSDYYERSFPLRKAFRKNIRKVIYSMDQYAYFECRKGHREYPISQWSILYDDEPFNTLRYYATIKNIYYMSFKKHFGLFKKDIDRPGAWFAIDSSARLFGGLNRWVDNNKNNKFLLKELPDAAAKSEKCTLTITHNLKQEYKAKEYIYEYLLKYVEQYPNTEFYCLFPPYFRYVYAQLLKLNPEMFFLHQEIVKYLVEKSSSLPNLHVYGFEDQDFLDDIANYKDTTHYHQRYNSVMLDAIRGGNELTPENVEHYLRVSLEKAWNFDMAGLNAEAQRLLRERKAARGGD